MRHLNSRGGPSVFSSRDLKWGTVLVSLYFVWAVLWGVNIVLFKGSPSMPYLPAPHMESELFPPLTHGFVLGTDIHGRSLFEVVSMGLLYSMGISLMISLMAATIGTLVGYWSVTAPVLIRKFFLQLTNITFVFPGILLAILIISFFGSSASGLVFSLVATGWAGYARTARGEVKRIMGLPYIEATRALGVSSWQLFLSGVLPGIFPQMLVHVVLGISGVILSESALGFLGLGGSRYSWGSLLSMGKTVLLEAPHISLCVGLVMAGLMIGLNLMGDGLRDVLDPKMKR